jgi:hypothetical protein
VYQTGEYNRVEFMEKGRLVHLGIIGIVIVLIIVIAVTGIPLRVNTPSATTCPLHSSSESGLFISDVYGTDDSLSFKYTPKDAKSATYYTSYEIYEYGSPIIVEHNKVYANVAPANPIVINVSRQRNATYTSKMSIWQNDESCPLYQSQVAIAVGPTPTRPTETRGLAGLSVTVQP